MAIATELTHKTQLSESRHQSRAPSRQESGVQSPASSPDTIGNAQWILMFSAAGVFWLVGLALDLVIPFITVVMNYGVVFGIWMWAKNHNLKPPTFSSAARAGSEIANIAAASTGEKVGAGRSVAGTLDNAPGSDLLYIALGGITPVVYLAALWWNNHSVVDIVKGHGVLN